MTKEPKVKIKRKGGSVFAFEFEAAKQLLTEFPSHHSIAEPKKYEFKNGELIKKPKPSSDN